MDSSTDLSLFGRIKAGFMYEPRCGESLPPHLFFKHRYFRAFAFLMICLNTLLYNNWIKFSQMLLKDGAYSYLCTSEEQAAQIVCDLQRNSVEALFNIGQCAEFVLGFFAGLCLDNLGPWPTGFLGVVTCIAGWMFLIYSSQSLQLYIPGMILLTGSINLICFPCLCLGEVFPTKSGFVVSLVVAAQTAGTFVPAIMLAVWDAQPNLTLRNIVWSYLWVAYLPITLMYLLAVPYKRLLPPLVERKGYESPLELTSADDVKGVRPAKLSEEIYTVSTVKASEVRINVDYIHTPTFFKQIVSQEYILFSIYYVLQVIQFGYYQNSINGRFENAANFLSYALWTQGIFGSIFGLMVDRTKTLPICIVLVIMMTLGYSIAIIENENVQYLTALLYVISNSYIYTVKYTYVAELFPPTHFGLMIGLIGCVAGAIGLLNIPIQNANQYFSTCIGYVILGFLASFIIVYLWLRQRKGIHYRMEAAQVLKIEDDTCPERNFSVTIQRPDT